VLADKLAPAPAPTPAQVAEQPNDTPFAFDPVTFDAYTGNFELEEQAGFVMSFKREGEKFYTQATGQRSIEIRPESDSTFALVDVNASVTFHREPDGSVTRVTLHQHGDHDALRVDTSAPPSVDLAPYA